MIGDEKRIADLHIMDVDSLTLVDDHTRFSWIYFMKQKSDGSCIIPKFFNLIETQFHSVIKKFISDNAPELHFA